MPECENCGAHVTEDYKRVFGTGKDGEVLVCPDCPDKKRGPEGRPVDY